MNPTKEQMLSRIYEVIADKTFSYGLNIIRNGMSKEKVVCVKALVDGRFRLETFAPSSFNQYGVFLSLSELQDIISVGHPVMIGDVLDWMHENDIDQVELDKITERKGKDTHFTYTPASVMVIWLWKAKRKPIDDQSDETIAFVYSLLPTEN